MHKSLKKIIRIFTTCCLFIAFGSLSNCKDTVDDDPNINPIVTPCNCLPPITTTGAGTFGCKVNGKLWVSKRGRGIEPQWWEYFNNHVIIHGYNDDSQIFLNLEVGNLSDTGMYTFYSSGLERQWGNYLEGTNGYWADTLRTGYLHILRLDLVNGIISGTFEMDLYDKYHQHGNDTLHITEGRFDF